jgi:hypothetical protein
MGRASRSKALRRAGGPAPVALPRPAPLVHPRNLPRVADRSRLVDFEVGDGSTVKVFVPCPDCRTVPVDPFSGVRVLDVPPESPRCGTCFDLGWAFSRSYQS